MCINTPHNHPITSTAVHQLALPLTAAVHAGEERSIYIHYSPVNCLDSSDWIYPPQSTGSAPRSPWSHGKSQCLLATHGVDSCVSALVVVSLLCMLNGAVCLCVCVCVCVCVSNTTFGIWVESTCDWMGFHQDLSLKKKREQEKKSAEWLKAFKTQTYMKIRSWYIWTFCWY